MLRFEENIKGCERLEAKRGVFDKNQRLLPVIKALIIIVVTKIAIKYWMVTDSVLLYWGIVFILLYSWNHIGFGKGINRIAVLFGAALLSISVFSAYLVKNQFILSKGITIEMIGLGFSCWFSWLVINSFCLLCDWISSRKFFCVIDINKTEIGDRGSFLYSFIFILSMWIPYFLTWYPGLIFADSANSIYQALGIQQWSNHFPVVYTLFIKACINIGIIFGDLNIGYAIYTLLQMIIMASVLAYVVSWLRNKGFLILPVFCCLYYAFDPCFPQHAIAMWKDGIFSVALLFLSVNLFDLVASNGLLIRNKRFLTSNIISSLVICFFRNNGVYIIAFICLCLGLHMCFDRSNLKYKMKYIMWNCGLIVLCFVVTGNVYRSLGIDDDEVEKYGILLQQVGRTVVEEGSIDEGEYDFLNRILPIDKYKEVYNSKSVDSIKWDGEFNNAFFEENQSEFIGLWINLFIKNPKIYIKSFLEMTNQYWVPNSWEDNKHKVNFTMGNLEVVVFNPRWEHVEVRYRNLLGNKLMDTQQIFSITTPMTAVGLLVWLMILTLLYALNKKSSFILSLAPCAGALITLLIATPISYWPRYMLIAYLILPVILGMIPLIGKGVS